ncbi:hypothetical protein D932_03645 [Enterococcus casseliflavus 14-MB-W-14]|nr:hypothetical protein D932_03645 [Enterococcus casseliflavus 14-MB-W-14]
MSEKKALERIVLTLFYYFTPSLGAHYHETSFHQIRSGLKYKTFLIPTLGLFYYNGDT